MPRVEGFHETYSNNHRHVCNFKGQSYTRYYSELELLRWRIRFGVNEFLYETAEFDVFSKRISNSFSPQWRAKYDDLSAIQLCLTRDFDPTINIVMWNADRVSRGYFGLELEEFVISIQADPLKPAKTHRSGVMVGPSINTRGYKAGEAFYTMYAFFNDGTRKIISTRIAIQNAMDGTRGYEALLIQQAAITNGIVDARTKGSRNRLKDYEQSQYL